MSYKFCKKNFIQYFAEIKHFSIGIKRRVVPDKNKLTEIMSILN